MRGFNYKKAVQSLNYLALKSGGELNKMKAIKLIWLADRLHLRNYARTITGDVYFALPNGPVCSTTRDLLEQYEETLSEIERQYADQFIQPKGRYYYSSINGPDLRVFSKSDTAILDVIWCNYGALGEFELVDLSHQFPEWEKYRSALERRIISRANMDLFDFFINYEDGSGLFMDTPENIEDSKALYQEHLAHSSI